MSQPPASGKSNATFDAFAMRQLLRNCRTCTLSTLQRDTGIPYGSVANLATLASGEPLLLISRLAWHTQNLLADGRASILASKLPKQGDALVGERVTVLGQCVPTQDPSHRRRYLAQHPEAAGYIDFADFSLWRMQPSQVHGVAGFGRIETFAAQDVFLATTAMSDLEVSALAHMNEDHAPAVRSYATQLLEAEDGDWQMTAIDGDGANLSCGGKVLRLNFPHMVATAEELRQMFVRLSQQARV